MQYNNEKFCNNKYIMNKGRCIMELKYDKPLTAMLFSILGGFLPEVYLRLMMVFQLVEINATVATSMMFIREGSASLGILSHIGYSAVLGLAIYHSPKILGIDYFLLKAMFVSMVAESLLFIVFGTLARNEYMMVNTVSHFVLASAAAIGGLFRGFLIKRYTFDDR